MPHQPAWPGRGRQGNGKPVQKQVDSLLLRLQPTTVADERRRAVFEYVQEVVQREVPNSTILPVGSFPLKTYLPYADVDMVMFTPRSTNSTGRVGDLGGDVGAGSSGKRQGRSHDLGTTAVDVAGGDEAEMVVAARPPALVTVNQALCTVAALSGAKRGAPPHSRPWPPSAKTAKPEIRNVSFINARTPIVTMVVGNVVVDLTENQGGSVAASALLEEADNLIQRDHLFKRSLLLLKAWAWCETPRLVGKRVLGAQKGGLTSYGLSVMVLHLFALRASADTLVHPLDVLVRFFEVYSEFDWGRYCLTLDGPVPFESVRAPRPCAASQGEGSTNSRLQPLVRRVLAEFSPTLKKEKEPEKEKEKGKPGRRGRRASRFGRSSAEGRGEASSPADADAASAAAAAAPHFPRRDCNIQDPLNALNNLGHSVTKNNLRALERALQHGRHQLEAWQLLPRASSSRSPRSNGPQRRPRETEGTGTRSAGRSQGEGRGAQGRRDVGRSEVGAEAQDQRMGGGGGGHSMDHSPQPAAPVAEQFNSSPQIPRNFGPPTQFVLIPPRQAGQAGANMNAGAPQPMLVPSAHPHAAREGQPVFVAFPQPFLQTVPHHFRFGHQPQQFMVQHGQGQAGMQRPHTAVLLPAPGVQTHPDFSPQWQLQRVWPSMFQGDRQLGADHQTSANRSTPPSGWREQATTARSEVVVAAPEMEARCMSAPTGGERKGSPGVEKEHCRGVRRKRPEEARDPAVQDSMLPWDLPAFVNASPTSSTASLSDFVEDGSKDGQDCQLQYESGADDEVHGGPHVSSFDGSDHSDAMVDTRHHDRGEGPGGGTKSASGNLWANWFLREFFPECCQRYGSGDGFREDLLDHPCQRRSKLQEPGSPLPRRPGAPDVLQGASRDVWKSLTAVGEMLREVDPQANGSNVKEAEPRAVNGGGGVGPDGGGQGGGSWAGAVRAHAGVERRGGQAGRTGAAAPSCTGGDRPAPSANTGGGAGGMAVLQPSRKAGEGGSRGRPQRAGGAGLKSEATEVRLQVSVDDETDYTTSEEQGDREDAVLSTASTPPIPPAGNQFPVAKVSPASASILTLDSAFAGKAGVDRGVQCSGPEPKLMVSTASQCEGPARISISAGVQCSMPAPPPPASWCGSQCFSSDIGAQASTGVQCSLLVAKDPQQELDGAKASPMLVGVGSAESLADLAKDEGEEACDSNSDGRTALPQSLGPSEQAQLTPAGGAIGSSAGACEGDRGTPPKSKKKRRKPKATGAAGRPPTVEDATLCRSPGVSKATRGGVGGWTRGLTRQVLVCGILGFVLAAVWGMAGRPGGPSWQGGGVEARHGAHEGQEDRAQPPVWVTVGGSLTLGDVLASRRPVAREADAGEVQWFRDGRLLPGQIRPFLTISGASSEDEGTYACFAVEESGRIGSRALWEEATVRISEPPVVESQLQTQRLARGEMLAIIATASGVPQPEYQWRRNGVPIPGANRPMLVSHSVTEADMGTYTCDVYNVAGRAQWEEMAVILREDVPKRKR